MQSLTDWKPYAWISLGAIAGANLRYFLSRIVTKFTDAAFPYGTLIINVSGSLVLGFFLVWTTERVLANPHWRWLVAIGFCGSYTTFSSYAFETMVYFEQGNWGLFAANILSNNLLCLGAVIAGAAVARGI
jgi:CrcB protein